MPGTRSLGRWTAGTSRTSAVLGVAAALLVATMGVGQSAGGSAAAATPTRLHIGPLAVCTDCSLTINFAVTNLSDTAHEVNFAVLDQDGNRIAQQHQTIAPGRTGIVDNFDPGVFLRAVRGRLVSPEGGRWALSLALVGTDSGFEGWTDRAVAQRRLPDSAASTALIDMSGGSDTLTVNVVNLSNEVASYRVRLINAMGDVVDAAQIQDLNIGRTSFIEFDPSVAVRAVVIAPGGDEFLALAHSSSYKLTATFISS